MLDPKVKGVAFRSVLTLVERSLGPSAMESAVSAMPEEVAKAHRYGEIIASGWYPIAWYRETWQGILGASGRGDDFVRKVGRDSIDLDFGSIYRTLMRVLSPKTLVSVGMTHFGQIYDTGNVETFDPRDTSLRLRFTGCAGFDHTMWVEVLGSCERLAELTGAKNARSTILEAGWDEKCVAIVEWT
jgi:hypothetical protein